MTTMTVTKVVLFAWLLSNHFSVADDSHELIKRVLPLKGKWKTRKAGTGTGTGTGTETETEIRKRSSYLKVSIVRVDGNSMQVCW